jgi:hypothetical protein
LLSLTLGAAAETLREQCSVTLAGAQETWRLVWIGGTGTVAASHPERPLIMPQAAWQALLTNPGPTAVETWACWDHGSDARNEIVVSARNGVIQARSRQYSCPSAGEASHLLSDTEQ